MRRHAQYQNMIAAYRSLTPAERSEVDAHLAACPSCSADLAIYNIMDRDIHSLASPKPGALLRQRFVQATAGYASAEAAPTHPGKLQLPEVKEAPRPREPFRPASLLLPAGLLVVLVLSIVIGMLVPDGTTTRTAEKAPAVAYTPEHVTLRFSCSAISNYDALNEIIMAFEAENPDIAIDFTPAEVLAGGDEAAYHEAVKQAAKDNDVFCAMVAPTDLETAAVRDLTRYIEGDPDFNRNDFYPGLLHTWQKPPAILSVPTYFRPLLIAYDPIAFDKAGLAYPQPGWTWDEFLQVTTQLTVLEGDEIKRWGFGELGATLLHARSVSLWNPNGRSEPAIEDVGHALRWLQVLYWETQTARLPEGLLLGSASTYSAGQYRGLQRAGRFAMWDVSLDGETAGGRLAPYPVSRPDETQWPGARLGELVLSGQTAYPQQGWRWISYLSRRLPDSNYVQARRSLAEAAAFWSTLDPSSVNAYRYALDHLMAVGDGYSEGYVSYMEAAVAVVKGEQTADEAFTQLISRLRITPTVVVETATATPAASP